MTGRPQAFECRNVAGVWWVLRRADNAAMSSHVSFGSAFHEMERLEAASREHDGERRAQP